MYTKRGLSEINYFVNSRSVVRGIQVLTVRPRHPSRPEADGRPPPQCTSARRRSRPGLLTQANRPPPPQTTTIALLGETPPPPWAAGARRHRGQGRRQRRRTGARNMRIYRRRWDSICSMEICIRAHTFSFRFFCSVHWFLVQNRGGWEWGCVFNLIS
jgi:hypothetical protein